MSIDNFKIKEDRTVFSFLGRGWAFPVFFNKLEKNTEMVSDFKDIEQSLKILFGVTPGERVTQLSYGCDILGHIFDAVNGSLEARLTDKIERAIYDFEPRVDLLEVKYDKSQYLEGVLKIEIIYQVRATNTRHNIVFPFYKYEGTSLPIDVV